MAYKVLDGAYAKLAGSVAIGATSITLETGKGALFDVGADHSYITFENAAGTITETVKLTGRSGDTLTTLATTKAWNIGDIVECRPCAAAIADINAAGQAAAQIAAAAAKATPDDADKFGFIDSADSWALKYFTFANLKAAIFAAWGSLINGGTSKATPVDADALALMDSEASNATKKLTIANLIAKALASIKATATSWTAVQTPATGTASVSTTSDFVFDPSTHGQVCTITLTNAITVTLKCSAGKIVAGTHYTLRFLAGDTSARSFAKGTTINAPGAALPITTATATSGARDVLHLIGVDANTAEVVGAAADVR